MVLSACGLDGKHASKRDAAGDSAQLEAAETKLNEACREDLRSRCRELGTEIKRLELERKQAIEANDQKQIGKLNTEISFRQELLAIYRRGDDSSHPDVQTLQDEYQTLQIFLRSHTLMPYSPNEKQAVAAVTRDFGPLYIKESPLREDGKPQPSVAKTKGKMPWTSYWYPKRDRTLFEGETAPLVKFDQVLVKRGRVGNTAAWEQEHVSDFYAEWEGLCDAWALAAIQTREPRHELSFEGVTFGVGDLKALTVKMFEGSQPQIYGHRYLGDYSTDGEIQDLRPEAFHKVASTFLGERNQLIAVDDDPGPEVWAKPFFHLSWVITKDPELDTAYLVSAFPHFVNNRNAIANDATQPTDIKAPAYRYRLYVDPASQNERGEFKVIYGEWMGSSRMSHPDMIFVPSGRVEPANKNLGANLDVLRELLRAAGVLVPGQFEESPNAEPKGEASEAS